MKHKISEAVLNTMREKGFAEWLKPDASGWGEPVAQARLPASDATDPEIRRYVKKVKSLLKEMRQDLESQGADEYEIDIEAPEWPLEDDAPTDAIRAYIAYLEENMKAGSEGKIID